MNKLSLTAAPGYRHPKRLHATWLLLAGLALQGPVPAATTVPATKATCRLILMHLFCTPPPLSDRQPTVSPSTDRKEPS